jgi:VWFA-related protein
MVVPFVSAQSGRNKDYSESPTSNQKFKRSAETERGRKMPIDSEDEVVRIETDLVTLPVHVRTRKGRPVSDLTAPEFKIFENGVEQEIAYFSDEDQPFTVALMLDMSYSSVFKLHEIQAAAHAFVSQLRDQDRVMVLSFDEKVMILCEPTSDRRVLRMAIEGARIGSGTSLYSALSLVLHKKLNSVDGRKAIVLLSDGVDTSSEDSDASTVEQVLAESDVLVYPIRFRTYDDVQKSRRVTAPIQFDEDDRRYTAEPRPSKGERPEDYAFAGEFMTNMAGRSGGRIYNVTSTTNLNRAFADIALELRKTYSLGYYPTEERKGGAHYEIKVRVYRSNLVVHTRPSYSVGSK